MMGIGNFREIGTAICKTQITRWNCSIICQYNHALSSRSIVSHFRVMYLPLTKAALVEHVKSTTHQAEYVWGQSIIANNTVLVLPSPRLRGKMFCLAVDVPQVALEGVPVTIRVHSSMQMIRTLLWTLQTPSYAVFKLTALLSCSMIQHRIIIYCVIVVLHLHTSAGTCPMCINPVAFMLTTVIPGTVWRYF